MAVAWHLLQANKLSCEIWYFQFERVYHFYACVEWFCKAIVIIDCSESTFCGTLNFFKIDKLEKLKKF